MANRIQIRNGTTEPTTSNLLPYELGWDRTTSSLYINNNGTIENIVGNYIRITPTTPTNPTSYYLTFTSGIQSNTNYPLLENSLAKVWIAANGISAYLVMGDSTHNGGITLYSSGGKYLDLVAATLSTTNRTITFPDATGTVFLNIGGTLTGNLWSGTTSGTTERQIGVAGAAGNLYLYAHGTASGTRGLYTSNVGGTSSTKSILTVDSSNNVSLNGHATSDLPLTGGTVTGSLILSKTQDAAGTSANAVALIVGGVQTAQHIEIDGNEILSKSNGTTPSTLYLQDSTGTVSVAGSGGLSVTAGQLLVKYAGSGGTVTGITFQRDVSGTSNAGAYITAKNNTISASIGVGSGGTNHGLYSSGYTDGTTYTSSGTWLIYRNSAGTILYGGGYGFITSSNATPRKVFLATSASVPSGAVAGDIVLVKV